MTDSSWGPGWPADRTGSMVGLRIDGADFPAGVHEDIADLMELLLIESANRGWQRLHSGWCWGYANRAIKTSSGGSLNVASNHSWGLAIDINAPANPFGGSSHSIPEAMGDFWENYGFRWGGHYSGTRDWMHMEFMGSKADAARQTGRARDDMGQDDRLDDYSKGEQAYIDAHRKDGGKDPGPPNNDKPPWFKRGWNSARFAANNPSGE